MREAASALNVGEGLGVNVVVNVGVSSMGWRTLGVHPIKPIRMRSVALTPSPRNWPLAVTLLSPVIVLVAVLVACAFYVVLLCGPRLRNHAEGSLVVAVLAGRFPRGP
jgi:hypothetical protein